jgi:hypothetical protein
VRLPVERGWGRCRVVAGRAGVVDVGTIVIAAGMAVANMGVFRQRRNSR